MRHKGPGFMRHHHAEHQALTAHTGKQIRIIADKLFKRWT
jgi:hypothetical protein